MCGITGIFHYNSPLQVDRGDLAAMRNSLRHRGPDGEGIYLRPDRKAGIASTRLAIRDLSSAGDQPFVDAASGVSVTFNGEIYNADALRTELEARGVVFRSSSDTEVLLRLYCEYDAALLTKINGIFAFAILDERRERLFLARDHLGVKPLYYLDHQGTFAFASEAKALLRLPGLPAGVNEHSVASYLTFACCPGPETLLRNVLKLPPATLLSIRPGCRPQPQRYWQPIRPELIDATGKATQAECIELVRDGLQRAVRMQLASDVLPTCSLSGGVDSSAVAMLMNRFLPQQLTCFTIGFGEQWRQYNEYNYARDVALQANAELVELCVTPDDVIEFLQGSYAEICDDPNADPVCSLAFVLAKEMRRSGFKVALSGEGADEIFIGYDRYLQELSAWRQAQSGGGPAPDAWFWGLAIAFPAQSLAEILEPDFARRYFDPARHAEPVLKAHREALALLERTDLTRRLSFVELQIRLPEILLMRVDKMSMANSVEYRVPFLDKELVELAFALPTQVKLQGGQPKSVLKSAVEGIIPSGNIRRKKMGFALPISEWLKDSRVGPRLTALLTHSRLMRSGIIRREAVLRLIGEHQSGAADRHFQLWTLLTLSLWYEKWAG
jgi:asparagine synthase (glutamine-hydrolysing)